MDDVERIDLVDDFHSNRCAELRPIRTLGVGLSGLHYVMPPELARRVYSASAYSRSGRDRERQAAVDRGIAPRSEPRKVRLSRICEYGIRDGRITDWYFTHNTPHRVSA